MGARNDNFSGFAKHKFLKERFVATPNFTKNQKLVIFLKENIDVDQKTQLMIEKHR